MCFLSLAWQKKKKKKQLQVRKLLPPPTKWLRVYVRDVNRNLLYIPLWNLREMHFKDIAQGNTLFTCNNDSGAEHQIMAKWHKAPETLQHKLTSISARNANRKGTADPYGATIAAVRECSSTQWLYLQSAMPHPTTEVLSRASKEGMDCPLRSVWSL